MSAPLSAPGARATLGLALAMSLLGISGLSMASGFLGTEVHDLPPAEVSPEAQMQVAVFELLLASTEMKMSWVADAVASGLLVFASLVLTSRRPTALWWARQALVANLVQAFLAIGAAVAFAQRNAAQINAITHAFALAQAEAQGQPPPPDLGGGALSFGLMLGCSSFLMIALYVVLLRVLRRDDVRSFIEGPASGG